MFSDNQSDDMASSGPTIFFQVAKRATGTATATAATYLMALGFYFVKRVLRVRGCVAHIPTAWYVCYAMTAGQFTGCVESIPNRGK